MADRHHTLIIPGFAVRAARAMWSEEQSPDAEVIALADQFCGAAVGKSNAVAAVALISVLAHIVQDAPEEIRALQALAIIAGFIGLAQEDEAEPVAPGFVDLTGLAPAGEA